VEEEECALKYVDEWLDLVGENPYLRALLILLAAIVAAKIVDWIVSVALGRWAKKTQTNLDDELVALLHRPLFLTAVLGGLALATHELELGDAPTRSTLRVLATIAIIVGLIYALRFSRLLLRLVSHVQDRYAIIQPRTLPLFDNLALLIIFGGAAYLFILAWEIETTPWVASAGIMGVAVSFAAKDSLANLFAGVFILADAPYKIGDFVILDSGERGRVTHIGLRSTRMLTRDDVEITIPNAVIGTSKIVNESGGPHIKERVRVQVSVAYGSDIDQVREALINIASQDARITKNPEPRVRFRRFGESGLELELLCWIDEPVLRGRMLDALNTAVYKRFQADGIEIPYPKRDVYIRERPASAE
jgi:small-conductance mechanosensitive channel